MTPQTNNAYYDDSMNEIVFPAGGLQPPFFDLDADDAVNYGEIGATIGHEMTHGFDDSGRQFDAKGNLKDWWTPQDTANFKARAAAIVKQYDRYVPVGNLHINGALTQGENIADIGGLKIAYLAFHKALETHPEPALVDGLTPDQRFFIAYAQSWRGEQRPESLREQVLTDPHSSNKFRVIGPVADMPEFAQTFHCPASETANQTATAGVW
jgi:putative endopeptidase